MRLQDCITIKNNVNTVFTSERKAFADKSNTAYSCYNELVGLKLMGELNRQVINFTGNGAVDFEKIIGRNPSCELESSLFQSVYDKTPEHIRTSKIIDIDNPDEFSFVLKQEHLGKYDPVENPEGLGLEEWFKNYEKEAKVSTAGIRGNQNILFPWDTRNPINLVGMLLATHAKAETAREKYSGKDLHKIAATEVRYNSDKYLDLIARVQAAHGITTHVPEGRETIPIWLASFLAFKLDLLGGEYVTSSHGISVKTATKDINDQGSQYLPEESMEFVDKIREIFKKVKQDGKYEIKLAARNDSHVREDIKGVDLYVDYLKNGVATGKNIDLIRHADNKIIIENVGGCAYKTLSKVLEKLGIEGNFEWFHTDEDPFFHSIGKSDFDPKSRKKAFYDYSVDASLITRDENGRVRFPVP